ncbi:MULTISPECIES: anti-sigma factor family protein [Streptomyces]|uniref:Zf-HC2 domain-containing protein n=1 Tax=Streptomyces edwardsiae TaxID=3075527 RepID=A0ABU2Q7V7_9ACTN|nr:MULTISPECIES: zf-HC2 domain-containing protein [unclassified Streptomyces]MDT0400526.1 zf-HC2 domain-containing protein [Streptomyces sp. DSM 41635]
MSGSQPKSSEGRLAEQHLGDRLSALVDGELGHDARERVLAHVATCAKCKTEVDAQRRLKNVFAEAAPPPPSESFLARLQGLPAGGDLGDGGSPLSGGGLPGGTPGRLGGGLGVFGARRGERFEFAYTPVRRHEPAAAANSGGFAVHDVGRHDTDRPSSRGLRFAFVAAGAVSLAAIALGGVTTVTPADAEARGAGKGSNVTPMRTQGTGAALPDSQRRRGAGPLLGQLTGQSALADAPAAPVMVSAPLLPGNPAPTEHHPTTGTPVTGGATALSPLIRPLASTPPLTLTTWALSAGLKEPGLVTAGTTPAPTATSR